MIPVPLAVALLLALFAGGPAPAVAQDADWTIEGQLGGSLSFGSRDQTRFSSRLLVERLDALAESKLDLSFLYGTAPDSDGRSRVNARSWEVEGQVDLLPAGTWRPFVSGSLGSSLERRIQARYDTGAGVLLALRDERFGRIDLSVALMAERTMARPGGPGTPEGVSLVRWSSSVEARHRVLDDRVELRSRQSYRPVFDERDNVRIQSDKRAAIDVTRTLALQAGLRIDYDSAARDRGAASNLDGRTEISVRARF